MKATNEGVLSLIQDLMFTDGLGAVDSDTNLDGTGADSMDIAEMAQAVETKYDENIKLHRFQVTSETTVGDLVDFFVSEINNPDGEESIFKGSDKPLDN